MALDSDALSRIVTEVTLGIASNNTDPEYLQARQEIEAEIAEATKQGMVPHPPVEF